MKVVKLGLPIVAIGENADSSIEVKTSDHLLRFDARSMELKSRDLDAVGKIRIRSAILLLQDDDL